MKVLKVIYTFFRGVVRLLLSLVMLVICWLIKTVTFEKGKDGQITSRKARRIRFFTRFKMFILNATPKPINRFLGLEEYRVYLNEHF